MPASRALIRELRAALRERADPAKAPQMQAYMKSEMPYLGVMTPVLRKTCKDIFDRHVLEDFESWRDTILALWRRAQFREERYAAITLSGHKTAAGFQQMKALPIYEEMITTGAWWDYVDDVASHRLGELLARHPKGMKKKMRSWARSRDLWKRRGAILCQLGFKERTDLELLYDCIEPSLNSDEFFLQKAIGWALRQYAWTDPDEVVRWVATHEDRLAPLSKREALKNASLGKSRATRRRKKP